MHGADEVGRAPAGPGGRRLAAIIGAGAAALLTATVALWEGRSNQPYRDLAGHWTVCFGDTQEVVPGRRESDASCLRRLEQQLVAHAEPVLRCVPQLRGRDGEMVAAASLAYNVGVAAFCGSTAARRFRAGDFAGGCDALLSWNKAKVPAASVRTYRARGETCQRNRQGVWHCTIRGLTNRRAAERAICLSGVAT